VQNNVKGKAAPTPCLVGEVPVVVPPRELLLDELLGGEGLHELDHL
jgi:hypothetical protein